MSIPIDVTSADHDFGTTFSLNGIVLTFTTATAAVPEPSTLALISLGGLAFAAYRRRRAISA